MNNKILIVDDSVPDRELIKSHLSSSGEEYNFFEAETVEQALEIYASQKPKCIILDYFLIDERGTKLIEELKRKYTDPVPIIMISGSITADLTKEFHEYGALYVFDKNCLSRRVLSGSVDYIMSL